MPETMEYLSDLCLIEDQLIHTDFSENILLKTLLKSDDFHNLTDDRSTLPLAKKLLLSFIQQNFVGPRLDTTFLPEDNTIDYNEKLAVDSEQLNVNVRNPECLYLAKRCLENLISSGESDIVSSVWYLRSIHIHQQVLDDRTGNLYEKFKEIVAVVEKYLLDVPEYIQGILLLEIVHGFMTFKRVTEVEKRLHRLKKVLKANLSLVSMLGFRTRFQTKPLPQMALKVETELDMLKSSETHKETVLPKLLRLDDDTRLEKIKFVNENDAQIDDLPSLLQGLAITEVQFLEIAQAQDNLVDEELKAYITTLLYQDYGPWSVRFAALLKNIKMESDHKRTVERSLKQCEDLMKLFERSETPLNHRISFFFCSGLPPIWGTEIQLGYLMMSLGFIKTALDLFIRVQAWEEVITCYNILNLRHKAEEVIRSELEKCPTEKLYCLLGDATDDVSHYETAWEFSNHCSARAKKHWGNYLFNKKQFLDAIPHLEKSLEINSLQEVLWLRLGFAGLETENWPLSARAYNRYTQLEPKGFESWNNLAKAYIKMGDKQRAHKILNESLKCNYSNWMVWENFMVVSLDTGHFEDVLNAYKRLMELKNPYTDKEVLKIAIDSIAQDLPDHNGLGTGRLKKKAALLLGEICTKFLGDGFYWELAARIYNDDLLMKTQKLQKAFSAYGQGQNSWSKEEDSCLKMIKICSELAEDTLLLISNDKSSLALSQLSSSRLTIQGCIRASSTEKHESCHQPLKDLQQMLDQLTNTLKDIQLQK